MPCSQVLINMEILLIIGKFLNIVELKFVCESTLNGHNIYIPTFYSAGHFDPSSHFYITTN